VVLIAVAAAGAWYMHFDASFHLDDFPAIVDNPVAHSLANVPRFFIDPKTYSALPRFSSYRPLLFTSFAYDYRLGGADPRPFQFDTFIWFGAQLFLMYFLFRLLTGGNRYAGLFAASLYGLHPAMADTLDYTLQRGEVIAGFGITAGLVLWIVWPRRLPADLDLMMFVKRVPSNFREWLVRKTVLSVSAAYVRIVRTPLPLYIVPVVLALLANPASAVFALLLLVYLKLYEPEESRRRMIPVATLCAVYWVVQAAFTWRSGTASRLPLFAYWYTQPWIAMRFLGAFFVPTHLSADSNFQPLPHFWSPLALAGYAGVAALVRIAVVTGRRPRWRAVSFGLWWFLITLLPAAIVPQQAVEADWRMYLPFAGLALAVTSAAFLVFERLSALPRIGVPVGIAAPILALGLLPLLAWATWERNQTWLSEENLWADVIAKDPGNGRALMNYGLILISENDALLGNDYLKSAAALLPRDASLEVHLAQLAASEGRDAEVENHYRRAIAFDPSYPPAYSYYSQWLLSRQRSAEAFDTALKAAKLDPRDLVARHTLMDVYADRSDWTSLLRVANESLRLDPNDPDGLRGLRVAQTGVDEVRRIEKAVQLNPTPDNYLSLSVVYFRNARYEDSIAAARKALTLRPDLPEAYFNIASVYHVMGKDDDAIAALRETLRIRPDFQMAKSNLDYELAKKGIAPDK
jgi:tetratricopeptide (TPR) repeat protein